MSKGRTSRRRKKRAEPNKVEAEVEKKNILFQKWLKEKFAYKPTSLRIASCGDGGGNGVFARKAIPSGDPIVSIPRRLMIGVHEVTVHSALIASILAYLRKLDDEDLFLTTVQILALFLIEERRRPPEHGASKSFRPYISMLPHTFTHLLYWNDEELGCLSPHLSHKAANIRNKVTHQLDHLNLILLNMRRSTSSMTPFDDVTWKEYIWAWCCVNTRCVFSDHQASHKLRGGMRKTTEDNYYLIPFLDMLNHHPQADVQAKYDAKTQHFQLITLSMCHKYDQLYIKYGEHGSLDLLLEYGFVPTPDPISNLNDCIEVDFNQLCAAFKVDDPSTKCLLFEVIMERRLHEDLAFIIHTGPSWSLIVCCILLANLQHNLLKKTSRQLLALICSGKTIDQKPPQTGSSITHVMKRNLLEFVMKKLMETRRLLMKCGEHDSVQMTFLARYYEIIALILDQSRAFVTDECSQFAAVTLLNK